LTLQTFIDNFVWRKDGIDSWRILQAGDEVGDCDDFAITVGYLEAGSFVRHLLDIWTFKNSFHRVDTTGGSHIVLHRRGMGYIDNIKPQWRADIGYKRKLPFIILPPVVMLKIFIGWIVK